MHQQHPITEADLLLAGLCNHRLTNAHMQAHMHAPTQMSHCSSVAYLACLIKAQLRECPFDCSHSASNLCSPGLCLISTSTEKNQASAAANPSVLQ